MDNDLKRNLGSQIRALRIQKGMTQEQLAISIGNSSKQYISALENGIKNVTVDVLSRIADALDVDVVISFNGNDSCISSDSSEK